MKGVKYIVAVALLLSLQANAKRAKKVDVVEPEVAAPTMKAVEMQSPGACECVTPSIELVDECIRMKKKACPIRFTTRSEWECVRTYEAGANEDECVTMHNGEVVTSCDPCRTSCRPCRPSCRPCRRRCRPCRPCRPCCE